MGNLRTVRTARKRQLVLSAIAEGLTAAEAAACAGMSRRALFEWKAADQDFAADYAAAYATGTDVFIAEARRRAFTESDTMLIFLLKSRDASQFNRRMIAIGGDETAPPIRSEMHVMIYPVQARPQIDGQAEASPLEVPRLLGKKEDEAA
jgi:hypothetical protein